MFVKNCKNCFIATFILFHKKKNFTSKFKVKIVSISHLLMWTLFFFCKIKYNGIFFWNDGNGCFTCCCFLVSFYFHEFLYGILYTLFCIVDTFTCAKVLHLYNLYVCCRKVIFSVYVFFFGELYFVPKSSNNTSIQIKIIICTFNLQKKKKKNMKMHLDEHRCITFDNISLWVQRSFIFVWMMGGMKWLFLVLFHHMSTFVFSSNLDKFEIFECELYVCDDFFLYIGYKDEIRDFLILNIFKHSSAFIEEWSQTKLHSENELMILHFFNDIFEIEYVSLTGFFS